MANWTPKEPHNELNESKKDRSILRVFLKKSLVKIENEKSGHYVWMLT